MSTKLITSPVGSLKPRSICMSSVKSQSRDCKNITFLLQDQTLQMQRQRLPPGIVERFPQLDTIRIWLKGWLIKDIVMRSTQTTEISAEQWIYRLTSEVTKTNPGIKACKVCYWLDWTLCLMFDFQLKHRPGYGSSCYSSSMIPRGPLQNHYTLGLTNL